MSEPGEKQFEKNLNTVGQMAANTVVRSIAGNKFPARALGAFPDVQDRDPDHTPDGL
jgi:hypothetical protein